MIHNIVHSAPASPRVRIHLLPYLSASAPYGTARKIPGTESQRSCHPNSIVTVSWTALTLHSSSRTAHCSVSCSDPLGCSNQDIRQIRICASRVAELGAHLSLNPLNFVHALSIRISQLDQYNRLYALFRFWCSARTTYFVDASGLKDNGREQGNDENPWLR